VDGEDAALMTCHPVIDEVTDDEVGLFPNFVTTRQMDRCDHAARATATQLDRGKV
jgi:hypothetical protein